MNRHGGFYGITRCLSFNINVPEKMQKKGAVPDRESIAMYNRPMPDIAYLLCGGKSQRMGQDKRFLPFRDTPLWAYQWGKLQTLFSQCWILLKEGDPKEACFPSGVLIKEKEREHALMVGILNGLRHLPGESAFYLSVDLPLVNGEIIQALKRQSWEGLALIPKSQGRYHFGVGFYHKKLLPFLEEAYQRGCFTLHRLFKNLPFTPWDIPKKWEENFINLNTPEDQRRIS